MAGSLSSSTDQDYYYFDVTSPQNITIAVDMASPSGTNWLLYHESDLNNYVAYPTSGLTGSYDATRTGRYYLVLYTWVGGDRPYSLTVR